MIGLDASPALHTGSISCDSAGYASALGADAGAVVRSGTDLSNFEPTVAA